jgi:polyhydroxybutyrate depolymerase
MRLISGLLLLLTALPLFAQSDRTISIASGGLTRTFIVHLPAAGGAHAPLLLCYHGSGETSGSIRSRTGFNALADQFGFVVAYPQGTRIKQVSQWNCYVDGRPGHGGLGADDAADDVQFTRDMIACLADSFGIDTGRVYAAGFSNGAYMCYALSMLASDVIHGIAPVAGDMWTDDAYLDQILSSGTARPMPVMHVHGTADNTVPYPDRDSVPTEYGEYPLFVSARGCDAHTYSQVINLMPGVDKLLFCPPPVEVCLIRIQGMGHAWTNGMYRTSREIVAFFGLDRSAGVTAEPPTHGELDVAPSPARDRLRVELPEPGRLEIVSSLGSPVYMERREAGPVEIPCSRLTPGVYIVSLHSDTGVTTTRRVVVTR